MEEIIKLLQENMLAALVAAFVLGGGVAWPLIKKAAAATPTKIDDLICDAIDKVIASKQPALDAMTVEQLDKLIPDRTLVELVKLRKVRWAAIKAAREAAAGGA